MSAGLEYGHLTRQPPTPVRLLHTPQPYADETFGSWFRRLAAYQHASREELAGALLGKRPALLVQQPIDWDLHPPDGLIERLSRSGTFDRNFLQVLIPSPSERLLRVHERAVYCPRCWEEDFRALKVHERRAWLDCWALRCVKHDEVLWSFKELPEPSLQYAAMLAASGAYPVPRSATEATDKRSSQIVLMPFMRKEFVRPLEKCLWSKCIPDPFALVDRRKHCGPQHIADWLAGRRLDMEPYWPESAKMGNAVCGILRDLVLFLGSAVIPEEPTLLESWQAHGAWLDDRGNRSAWPHVQARGPLATRLSAVSLAFAILCMMHDVGFARRAGESDTGHGLANLLLTAHRSSMLACLYQMLGTWPDTYFQRWFKAYQEALGHCRHLRTLGA
jgi:hypothetical protein